MASHLPRDCWHVIGAYAGYHSMVAACGHYEELYALLRSDEKLWTKLRPHKPPLYYHSIAAIEIANATFGKATKLSTCSEAIVGHIARDDTQAVDGIVIESEILRGVMLAIITKPYTNGARRFAKKWVNRLDPSDLDLILFAAISVDDHELISELVPRIGARELLTHCTSGKQLRLLPAPPDLSQLVNHCGLLYGRFEPSMVSVLVSATTVSNIWMLARCIPPYISAVVHHFELSLFDFAMALWRRDGTGPAGGAVAAVLWLLDQPTSGPYLAGVVANSCGFADIVRGFLRGAKPGRMLRLAAANIRPHQPRIMRPEFSIDDFAYLVTVVFRHEDQWGVGIKWLHDIIGQNWMNICVKDISVRLTPQLLKYTTLSTCDLFCGRNTSLYARAVANYDTAVVSQLIRKYPNNRCECGRDLTTMADVKLGNDMECTKNLFFVEITAAAMLVGRTDIIAQIMGIMQPHNIYWILAAGHLPMQMLIAQEDIELVFGAALSYACCEKYDTNLSRLADAVPKETLGRITMREIGMNTYSFLWLWRRLPEMFSRIVKNAASPILLVHTPRRTCIDGAMCVPNDLDDVDNCRDAVDTLRSQSRKLRRASLQALRQALQ